MQCIENVMSPGPRGPYTKNGDKWMVTSNKQENHVEAEPMSNIEQNEKIMKSDEAESNGGIK